MVSENLLIKPEYSVLQKMCSKFLIASCFLKITSAISLFEASKNEELIHTTRGSLGTDDTKK